MRRDKSAKVTKEKKVQPGKKSEGYVLKKNTAMKILRYIAWAMLIFVFVRGVITIFAPDKETEVRHMIAAFKADLNGYKELNNEAMAFAQNFAKEYLSYKVKAEQEYMDRIKPYVSEAVRSQSNIWDFKNSATASYVQAYRMEQYGEKQLDVYVLAEITYTTNVLTEDQGKYTTDVKECQSVLKVPLYADNGKYVVESLPVFVSDTNGIKKYAVQNYFGTGIKENSKKEVVAAIGNFLKAYYEQDETVINYYLSKDADKSKFEGLDGRYTFEKIVSANCYQEPGADMICLLEYQIRDAVNNALVTQKVNLQVIKDGSKYYIVSMDARTGNLKF